MKKIVTALAVAFLFFSCDNGGMETPIIIPEDLFSGDNPFVGTWESIKEEYDFDARLIFTENEISAHGKAEDGKYRTRPDNIWDYTFSDNVLIAIHKISGSRERCEYDFEKSKTFKFSGIPCRKISKNQIIN